MNKIDLILELVRDGKITTEQAKILMQNEKEYIPYYPVTVYPSYPTWHSPYTVTCGSTQITNGFNSGLANTTNVEL
jgi:hypothetical protein